VHFCWRRDALGHLVPDYGNSKSKEICTFFFGFECCSVVTLPAVFLPRRTIVTFAPLVNLQGEAVSLTVLSDK
jgi:hypothetical protein